MIPPEMFIKVKTRRNGGGQDFCLDSWIHLPNIDMIVWIEEDLYQVTIRGKTWDVLVENAPESFPFLFHHPVTGVSEYVPDQ